MTESELMRALECCADPDVARCSFCPLRFLGEDECRRRLTRAAWVRLKASDKKIHLVLQILKKEVMADEREDDAESAPEADS
ncbi:MAG: hypothetical protein IJF33_06780 [Clostridia bacterium]|nr:hypothetical protein [Clostridia bacterium]